MGSDWRSAAGRLAYGAWSLLMMATVGAWWTFALDPSDGVHPLSRLFSLGMVALAAWVLHEALNGYAGFAAPHQEEDER